MVPLLFYLFWNPPVWFCIWGPSSPDVRIPSGGQDSLLPNHSLDCCIMVRFACWETSAVKQGLQLASWDDLVFPSWEGDCRCEHWPISMVEETSTGVSFASLQSVEKMTEFRSHGPMAFIVKGFENERLMKVGFEADRLICTNLTVRDEIAKTTELRAVTLINVSASEEDFVSLPKAEHEIRLQTVNRMPLFVELRQTDAQQKHWDDLHSPEAFEAYVRIMLQKCGISDQSVRYKVFTRPGYVCQRLQIPLGFRDQVYQYSGKSSVQIRAVRTMTDAPEEGLEVIRLQTDQPLATLAEECRLPGSLGFFKSQGKTFYRTTDAMLGQARSHWFSGDTKFSSKNIGIKMRFFYVIEGFPLGVAAHEVTEVLEMIGWTAIPVRITNLRQFAKVLAAGAVEPPKLRFLTSIGPLQLTPAEKPKSVQKASMAIAPTPTRPRGAMKVEEPKRAARPVPIAPSQLSTSDGGSSSSTRPSTPSAPTTSLSSRVTQLEAQLSGVKSDVQGLKSSQEVLSKNLETLSSRQDKGFSDLMEAIASLSREASSQAKASPARKAPKK